MLKNRFLGLIAFFLLLGLASSSYISDGAFESHRSTGRSLLQTQKNCPISFENQNYTIITSECKGPRYQAEPCCDAFKKFACPFADELNDMSNNCANTMFSYIILYGKYPPGIFANMCKGDKLGLSCDNVDTSNSGNKSQKNSAYSTKVLSPMVVFFVSHLVYLFFVF